jgi:ATP:ADP antiporter, AAA family
MLRRVRRFLDVRAGEGGPLLYCSLFVAIAVASFILAKPIRNGLFLSEFGAYRLVYVYVGVPLVLAAFVPLYNAVAVRVGQRLVITGSLLFLSANVLAFWYGFTYHRAPWMSAAFYIWVNCYAVIAPVQAWSFANMVFDTRQARRLFGLVGSGASLGAILGGLLAQRLAPLLGAVDLMLVLAALIAGATLLVNAGWHVRRRDVTLVSGPAAPRGRRRAALATPHPRPPPPVPFADALRLVRKTPYLRLLALLVVLVAVVTQWINFLFSVAAEARFAGDADRLTEFFGLFNFYMGMVAFAVQLLLTGPLLRTFGMAFTILLLPISLVAGSTLILLFPVLWAVVIANGFDQALRFSVDKATFELLYLPIPQRIKSAVKGTIDLIVNRSADALGGLLLGIATQGFLLFPGLGLGMRGVAVMSLAGGLAWIAVATALRRGYVGAIKDSIQQHRLEAERAAAQVLDRSTADILAAQLKTGGPGEILYALDLFAAQHRRLVHPAVRGLVSHPSAPVRRRAIGLLNEAADRGALPEVEARLQDEDLGVRTEALLYLARHAHVDPLERISQLGDFKDHSIQASLVAFLSHAGETQNLDAARLLLDGMIGVNGATTTEAKIEAARLLEDLPPAFSAQLERLLQDEVPEVVTAAIRAAGRQHYVSFVPRLIEALAHPRHERVAGDALTRLGADAIEPLSRALVDDSLTLDARRDIPLVLARIGTPEAQEVLMRSLLQSDPELRFRIIQGLNRLLELHPTSPLDRQSIEIVLAAEVVGHYRSYQILDQLGGVFPDGDPVAAGLAHSMTLEQERIFRLMALLWPEQDLKSAYVGLRSDNRLVRANALEFLDNVLPPDLRRLLVPLLDAQVTIAERADLARRIVGTPVTSREEAVAALVASDDPYLRSCGVYAVGALHIESLGEQIARFATSGDPLLRETVRDAQRRLAGRPEETGEAATEMATQWQPGREAAGLG